MKKLFLSALIVGAVVISAQAQGTTEPYFNLKKFYAQANLGTARTQGMGGAFTALGGDISNTFINPAGLGFYNRSEFSGTFNFISNNTIASYIGTEQKRSRSPLDLGQLGVVFSKPGTGSRKKRGNFGVSYNTLASFSNSYSFGGTNTGSSISDSFAELANGLGKTPQEIADDYEFYGNTAGNNAELAVMGGLLWYENGSYFANEESSPANQSGEVVESGNLGQLNISYGANFDDKTYLGGSIGIQNLNFRRETVLDEAFPNGKFLRSLFYDNELSITGTGLNLTLGVIHRLNSHFNIGGTITTPTLMWVTDGFNQYAGVNAFDAGSLLYNSEARTALDQFKYRVTSPLKVNVGISAYLPNKIGVASLEAEYVGFSRMGLKEKSDASWSDFQNGQIQDEYKDVVNVKAGVELRKGIGRLRGGINFINDPLRHPGDFNVKKNSVIGSFGIGIRNSNFFADLSYSRSVITSAYTPYWIENTNFEYHSVGIKQTRGVVGITVGSFF